MTVVLSSADTSEPLMISGAADMSFKQVRQLSMFTPAGVAGTNDMVVTDTGAGQVGVSTGYAWVAGTVDTTPDGQYMYGVPLSAAKTLTGITSPSGATRRDLVVVRVYDEIDAPGNGGLNKGRIEYIKNAAESLTPEAAPANSYILYYCDVTTGGVKTLTDQRTRTGQTAVRTAPETIFVCTGYILAGTIAGGYTIPNGQANGVGLNLAGLFPMVNADHVIPGRTCQLRVVGSLLVNNVAPTGNFTVGLSQITSIGGGAGVVNVVGTTQRLATTTLVTPGAVSINPLTSVWTALNTTNFPDASYCFALTTTATIAASSAVTMNIILQRRYV
jgi:hypothetical protein